MVWSAVGQVGARPHNEAKEQVSKQLLPRTHASTKHTFLPRLYQVTVCAFRLAVRLPPCRV